MTYAERSASRHRASLARRAATERANLARRAATERASLARRAATERARFERQNGGPVGAAFARVLDFLFTTGA